MNEHYQATPYPGTWGNGYNYSGPPKQADPHKVERKALAIAIFAVCATAAGFRLLIFILPRVLAEGIIAFFPQDIAYALLGGEGLISEFFMMFLHIICLLIPALALILFSGQRKKFASTLKKPAKGLLLPPVFMAVAVIFVCGYALTICNAIFASLGITIPVSNYEMPIDTWSGFIISAISSAVIPAVFEEFLFRGAIMGKLRRFGDGFAVLVSAFLFGLMHLEFLSILNAFVGGLLLGYFVVRTGSLWVSIGMHFSFNFVILVSDKLERYIYDVTTWGKIASFLYSALVPVCILLGVIGLLKFIRTSRAPFEFIDRQGELSFKERIEMALFNPAMVILTACCVMYVVYNIYVGSPVG